ncbi:MAG: ferric uptake regulation protein [Fibrobacteres bacterium]|nr:ferric uptake regulation protein [Fibrobacterota bacterium]
MKRPESADPVLPYLDRLRQGKVKVTPNRRRVLGRFLESDKPWTLQSLHRSLGEECDLSSVYRALSALRAAGLLEEFRLPGEKETFFSLIKHHEQARIPGVRGAGPKARAHAHHHHHIVCQDCGQVSHLDICVPAGLMGKVEDASGFRITEHHLEFKGVCGDCR